MDTKCKKEIDSIPIDSFLKWLLSISDLKRGRDYSISTKHLWIAKHPLRGKVLLILKEYYPHYNFYWENPRILKWY